MSRLRVEFAGLLTTVTTHAVRQQATAMQQAAVVAVRRAVSADITARRKRDALSVAAVSAGVASMAAPALCGAAKMLGWL